MLPPWTPDIVSLELLLSVAETGSIAQAATAHGISQPSASTRLARLERRLGITLLTRRTTGTTLTPAGQAISAWAREVITVTRDLTDGVATLRSSADARLSIAASLTVAEYLLPGWLVTLRRRHPTLEVAASVVNSHEVTERVRSGAVDLGFLESPEPPTGVSGMPVGSDEVVLVAASGTDPLARRARAGIAVGDLAAMPLLMREPGSGTRDAFLEALSEALHRPQPPALLRATTLGSTATILAATRAGGAIGVLSERAAAADLAAGRLVRVPVAGLHATRPLTAVWLGREPTALSRELIAIAADSSQPPGDR